MKCKKILCVCLSFFPLIVFAQNNVIDSLQENLLDDIILTTKNQAKNINTARTVESLSLSQQKVNGANTLHQMLNTSSGVYMVDMGNEQHAMSIRLPMGYDPLYNYLENGVPLRPVGIFNNNELLELNRFSLNKIEIIKGPFSSLYGAQSIGASINFIQQNFNNSKSYLTLQSNGFGQKEAIAQSRFTVGSVKALININHAERSVDKSLHFNYNKQAYSIRLEKQLDANNQISIQSNIINYKGDQRDGYDSAHFYQRDYTSNDKFSDRKTLAIRNYIEWKHRKTDYESLSVKLFNRVVEENQIPFYLIGYNVSPQLTTSGQITQDKFTSYGVSIDHSTTSKNGKLKLNQSIYVDYTPNNRYTSQHIVVQKDNSFANISYTKTDSLVTNYKANLKNVAASISAYYHLSNKLKLFAALRADVLNYDFTNYLEKNSLTIQNSFQSFNPEVSVLYQINTTNTFFAQYGSGFTPPTLSKMYRGGSSIPQLNPARYYNTEIGYKHIEKDFHFQISAYHMNGVDEFINVIRSTGTEVINAGKTNHQGIEMNLGYTYNNFEFNYNPSFAKHTFKEYSDYGQKFDGNTMNSAPNYMHYANASYSIKQFYKIRFIAEWNKIGPYQINAANTMQYEGYDLFNLKTTFTLNKFFINLGVNNIFDKVYATNADGTWGVRYYPGLPRTFQLGCTYHF
ncbi:MAG: TonB-dependent receptor [Chitinophagaceae bacterium]|nr:TonB-dependent receptor [Chitinophagaceae bacterium]